jgi:nicotinamidase-related amidase
MALRLPVRYYRALPVDQAGYEHEHVDLALESTALVVMHCWNIGCEDGPAADPNFCVGMGWPQATAESERIMREVIRPTLDVARTAGLQVIHVETDWMDRAYPDILSRRQPQQPLPPGPAREMLDRAHGAEYLTRSPLAQMRRAAVVAPVGDEPMFFYSDLMEQHLRERGVQVLLYAGFAADMCILGAEGGARPMLSRGFRCILLRDATLGVETPESFPQRLATRHGIHRFEWQAGHSTTSSQLQSVLAED